MQGGGRAIVADVGDKFTVRRQRIDAGRVRRLVNEAAPGQNFEKIGFKCRHEDLL